MRLDLGQMAHDLAHQIVTDYGDADYWQETDDVPVDAIQGIKEALQEAREDGARIGMLYGSLRAQRHTAIRFVYERARVAGDLKAHADDPVEKMIGALNQEEDS